MAEFSRLMITGKGQALIAKMMADSQGITFTKVSSSDAVYELSQLEGLDSLTEIKQTSVVSKITRVNEATVKIETSFSNTELTEGYYMRALGLYAEDPDEGEILYAAAIETSGNCYLPAYGGMTVSGAFIQLVTTVGNAENVSLEVDNSAQATIGDIRDLQEQIDQLGGIVGGVSAQAGLNAAKLDALDRIGSTVFSREIRGHVTIGSGDDELKITGGGAFTGMDAKSFYLYVLSGSFEIAFPPAENCEGQIYLTMSIGYGADRVKCAWMPIVKRQRMYESAPFTIVAVDRQPGSQGIKIRLSSFIFKRNEAGEIENIEEPFDINASDVNLEIYKLGCFLDDVQDGSTEGDGVTAISNNYNILQNKPSINNVTLQGDMTSQQLGLGGDTSNLVEMTAEEVEAIINLAEESEE